MGGDTIIAGKSAVHRGRAGLPCRKVSYGFSPPKRWTIQKCLFILGAKPSEIYYYHRGYGVNYQNRPDSIKHSRSIYERYTPDELRIWADGLYREAMKKYHPNSGHRRYHRYYSHKTAEINTAYDKLKRILRYHGVKG